VRVNDCPPSSRKCVVADTPDAILRVPREHPIFNGHFPGMPLVPGVMLLEWALRETARALAVEPRDLGIRESKFFLPLRPEEQAELFLKIEPTRTTFRICRGTEQLATGVLVKT
jgi:3-hydroxyacyl-[acyl-carrier-protein] dehydratase